jgi:hypothetical protein
VERIGQIEGYYKSLQLADDTHWDEFIAVWLVALPDKETAFGTRCTILAQQCAIHLDVCLSNLEQDCKTASEAA